ncbi:MAG: hypothetical protein WCQ99_09785 [Pseudomonadota bacterium]
MYNQALLDEVKIEDLPPEYSAILERIVKYDIDRKKATLVCLEVGLECGGLCYPLKKIDSALSIVRKRLALKDLYSGKTYSEVARKYSLSEQAIRDFHSGHRQERRERKKNDLNNS